MQYWAEKVLLPLPDFVTPPVAERAGVSLYSNEDNGECSPFGVLKFVPQLADVPVRLQMKGTAPMTKIEAFRRAVVEMGDSTPEKLSAFIENKFGVVISPPYIPIFHATLRLQKIPSPTEKSEGSSCLPNAVQ